MAWAVVAIVILLYALPADLLDPDHLLQGQPSDIGTGKFWPSTWTGENYQSIFAGSAKDLFLPALRNSIGIALIATVIAVVLATLAAYAIARLDFPGKSLILTTALAVSIFPVDLDRPRRCSTCGARSGCTTPGSG